MAGASTRNTAADLFAASRAGGEHWAPPVGCLPEIGTSRGVGGSPKGLGEGVRVVVNQDKRWRFSPGNLSAPGCRATVLETPWICQYQTSNPHLQSGQQNQEKSFLPYSCCTTADVIVVSKAAVPAINLDI